VKIVFAGRYNDGDNTSGPEHTAYNLFNEHSKSEHSVFIQYFFDGRKYSLWKKLFGKILASNGNRMILTLGIFRIFPELRKLRPSIIHLLTFERFAVTFYLYRLIYKVKIIYNSHGVIEYENSVLKYQSFFYRLKDRFAERTFLKHSDKIVFPSVNTLSIAEKYCEFDDSNSVILPNGIDEIFFIKAINKGTGNRLKAVIQHKNTLNNSGIELLFAAHTTAHLPIDIFIITSSDLKLPLKDDIKYFTVPHMNRNELVKFYSDKDIYLSLNSYDTFSIGTAEAMASGLIPVVTSETGISRYIEHGVNGFTFSYSLHNDLAGLLDHVSKLTSEQRESISHAAQETASSLKWNNIHEMYVNIYKGMIT